MTHSERTGPVIPALGELLANHEMLLAALETPEFWNRELGAGMGSTEVTGVHLAPVGTGQVASCSRASFTFDRSGGPARCEVGIPGSVVIKTASANEVSRMTSAALRHAEIEVGFYRTMAAECGARTPRCHLAGLNDSGDDFILVLEDLAQFTQADQIRGMAPDDVAAAVDELAALHATWWGTVPAGTESFLVDRGDPAAHATLLGMLYPGFTERYADRLDREVLEVADRLVALAGAYLGSRPGPTAVVHGDFRPDNLLVPLDGSDDRRVAVVDWQTVTFGPALADLSYFLGGAMPPEVRAGHETDLLDRYRRRLTELGVDLPPEELRTGYRRYALDGLVMAIGASQVVGQTERGDEMFCAMAERSARHAVESATFDLL